MISKSHSKEWDFFRLKFSFIYKVLVLDQLKPFSYFFYLGGSLAIAYQSAA